MMFVPLKAKSLLKKKPLGLEVKENEKSFSYYLVICSEF